MRVPGTVALAGRETPTGHVSSRSPATAFGTNLILLRVGLQPAIRYAAERPGRRAVLAVAW
jgi:hypothetical protein